MRIVQENIELVAYDLYLLENVYTRGVLVVNTGTLIIFNRTMPNSVQGL